MKLFINIILLFFTSIGVALDNSESCSKFNKIALQLALTQPTMQAPLNLEHIQNTLGRTKPDTTATITTYTWTHKNRLLLVRATNSDLTTKMLTGNDDGSPISKKMQQIHKQLQTATSIWSIKEIEKQLGAARITKEQIHHYSWYCDIGTLEIITDQNDMLTTATISYRTSYSKEMLDAQLGFNHPPWDIATDSPNEIYRAWKRVF